ncbi:unnamed protein product [Arabidopsis arenosa]|uniref:Uncharacterized protein n=1 Tax=Arabidopsis arenosa TaxID=38785 RepID=A0A8S2A3E6_ARAAE|nr:unnamed protein product [Arabidopsis arenosa]
MMEAADVNSSLGLDSFEDEAMVNDSRKVNLALFSSSVYEAGSSGLSVKQKSPRKRKAVVMKKNSEKVAASEGDEVSFNIQFDKVFKRKTLPSVPEESTCLKMDDNTVVHGEPPLDHLFKICYKAVICMNWQARGIALLGVALVMINGFSAN